MNEIKCPHCGKAFTIDGAGYAEILKQVRDSDFDKQLHERLLLAEKEKQAALDLANAKSVSDLQQATLNKDKEIQDLKAKLDSADLTKRLEITQSVG